MIRYITPTILIAISITLFFVFVNPLYNEVFSDKEVVGADGSVSSLKAQETSYNKALDNSAELKKERDKLLKKYNDISKENLVKISKLLPDNVDNIRLIIELDTIARSYGMVLKDVKSDTPLKGKDSAKPEILAGGSDALSTNKEYGIWNLEFSTEGTYNNFLNFVRELQNNLRIVDIVSVQFSSDIENQKDKSGVQNYKYTYKIQTYWLKN